MERKIGEIFEYKGEWYQCVYNIHGNCDGCSFSHINSFEYGSVCCESYLVDIHGKCGKVIFKKLEKVGEPYPNAGKLYQLYKLPMNIEKLPPHTEGINLVRFDIVEIELKQNKEDMEENKLNLKPFDIQKAREGKPVYTRDGRKARVLCYDLKGAEYPIVAAIEIRDGFAESIFGYDNNGRFDHDIENNKDLMMLSEKKEGWINIYNADTTFYYVDGRVFETKDEAIQKAKEEVEKEQREKNEYIDTIRVEWEE